MRSLATLPPAVLFAVSKELDACDCCSLLRCSRHFYDLLSPALYERVVLHDGEGIVPLVLMLCSKPQLALYPQSLQLCGWTVDYPVNIENPRPYHNLDQEIAASTEDTGDDSIPHAVTSQGRQYDLSVIKEKVKSATHSDRELQFWMKDLAALTEDAWMALLLTLLPNLKRLELQFPSFSKYVPWILNRAANQQLKALPIFTFLTSAYLDWWDIEGGLSSSEAIPFFRLPNMRRFYTNMLVERPNSAAAENVVEESSPITHIEMNRSSGTAGFRDLIPRCKNLVSFKYNHESRLLYDGGDFSIENVYESLLHARDTLETIWLDFEPFSAKTEDDDEGGVASFTKFKRLTHLHVCASMLSVLDPYEPEVPVIRDILPSGIEKLYISGIDWDYANELVTGLENHASSEMEHTPRLKEVVLEGELKDVRFDNMYRTAAQVGIKFHVQEDPRNRSWGGDDFTDYPFPDKL